MPDAVAAGDIDDANAQRTTCSQFFTLRKVNGGGVTYDEYFGASEAASAGLSLPVNDVPVTAQASHQSGRVVRVQYRLTDKWIADLTDPAAYDARQNHLAPTPAPTPDRIGPTIRPSAAK